MWFIFILASQKFPRNIWVQGLCTWLGTLLLGHIFRSLATGAIAQTSFIIVSVCALGILFFTWRGIATFVLKGKNKNKKG